jgi:hypothetical protein
MSIAVADLNMLRRDYARMWLVDRCDVLREPAATADDFGQAPNVTYPAGWEVIATSQQCRLIATTRRANEGASTGQVQSAKDGVLLLKVDVAEILPGDRVRITTRSPVKTFHLEVAGSLSRTDKMKAMIDVVKLDAVYAAAAAGGEAILDSNGASILDSDGEEILDSAA